MASVLDYSSNVLKTTEPRKSLKQEIVSGHSTSKGLLSVGRIERGLTLTDLFFVHVGRPGDEDNLLLDPSDLPDFCLAFRRLPGAVYDDYRFDDSLLAFKSLLACLPVLSTLQITD